MMREHMRSPRRYRLRGRVILAGLLFFSFGLAGCTFVPTSGPTVERFNETLEKHNPLGLRVVKVNPNVIKVLEEQPLQLILARGLANPEPVGRIGVGDVLSVSIFETPPALFSPTVGVPSLGGAGAAAAAPQSSGATLTTLPPLEVAANGTVEMPYGGRLHVAGMTVEEVQQRIAAVFKNKSISPQVIVAVSRNVANTVFVIGDVKKPGRYPLDLRAEHLLDMLTLAGGPTNAPSDETVELVRGDTRVEIPFDEITPLGSDNFELSPGDHIVVRIKPRTYTVFGSSGRITEIDFKSPTVTLAEGLARASAVTGGESDATGVYLFRLENPSLAHMLGVNAVRNKDGLVPVIYRVNLMDPTSYVLLSQFRMRNKDLIYVANARSVPLQKFLNLIAALFTPLTPAASIGSIVASPP